MTANFGIGQRPLLVEDVGRHPHLAEIVDETGQARFAGQVVR